jgi:hypothetical protein
MPISNYHSNHTNRTDNETNKRGFVKELELKYILNKTNYSPSKENLRIAVLGCADKRFVKIHKEIFEKLLKRNIEQTTFDITTEHLEGAENIIRHDVTKQIPNAPFDIVFAHVLLKFIETDKQWDVIRNAYEALLSPGLGVFVYDLEDIATISPIQADGHYSVPLDTYKKKLEEKNIEYRDLQWDFSNSNEQNTIRGLKGGALVIEK